jgi:hypothetical protein
VIMPGPDPQLLTIPLPFHTVRRLVQQEDYALHKLYAAGLPTPRPYGFVELTPDWEYLLVTESSKGRPRWIRPRSTKQ